MIYFYNIPLNFFRQRFSSGPSMARKETLMHGSSIARTVIQLKQKQVTCTWEAHKEEEEVWWGVEGSMWT